MLYLTRSSRKRCCICWSCSVKSRSTKRWCSPTCTQGDTVALTDAFLCISDSGLDHRQRRNSCFNCFNWLLCMLVNSNSTHVNYKNWIWKCFLAPTGLSTWQTSCPPKVYLLCVSQVKQALQLALSTTIYAKSSSWGFSKYFLSVAILAEFVSVYMKWYDVTGCDIVHRWSESGPETGGHVKTEAVPVQGAHLHWLGETHTAFIIPYFFFLN